MKEYLYSDIKLCATVVSDTHIDEKHPVKIVPMYLLMRALKGSKRSKSDVFLTVGDTTSRGSAVNWKMARECFKKIPGAAKKIMLTIGNHDGWNDDDFDAAINEYYSAYKDICGREISTPYFSENINGCCFICIGTDSDSGCEAAISDEQMEWFRNEMAKAGETKNPIFVFCHQSLNQRHGLPRTWDRHEIPDRDPLDGGIGERSDEVAEILKKYKNVFYFSGHSHMGLCGEDMKKAEGYSSFEDEDGVTLINLPSLACGNHHGEIQSLGIGIQIEVYEDRVLLRPKNYISGKFITKLNIKDKKPYYEKML
ncbi:MAG: metallophosphoesterase [Clostridia bacterium]|nr:metallophosphoesterase [Clostridia bacterium]